MVKKVRRGIPLSETKRPLKYVESVKKEEKKELFRPVVGYKGLYAVNEDGEVYNERSGYALTPVRGKYVTLCKEGTPTLFKIAEVVASAWIPNPFGFRYVKHKDGNVENNNVENLEWVAKKQHALSNYAKSKQKKVWQADFTTGMIIQHYESIAEASMLSGVAESSIVRCCRGQLPHAGGWLWKYVEE